MAKPKLSEPSPATKKRYDLFIAEYLKDRNASRAAKAAGYSPKTAGVQGFQLLKIPYVADRVAKKTDEAIERAEIEAEEVLRLNWQRATADVNDLMQVRRGACRHCHGEDHAYQWRTKQEFDEAFVQAAQELWVGLEKGESAAKHAHAYLDRAKPEDLVKPVFPGMPTLKGGVGYRKTLEPHPDCPYCDGDGVERAHIPDTRDLPQDGRAIYEGFETTKDGVIKLKVADRGAALNRVAQIMGLYKTDMTVTPGDGWGALLAKDIDSGALGFTPPTGQIPANATAVLDEEDEVEP